MPYKGIDMFWGINYISFVTCTNFQGKANNLGYIFEYSYKNNELISHCIEEMSLTRNWFESKN